MSHKYYYFVASLPMLSFGVRPPMANEEFISFLEEFLTPGDLRIIKNALLIPARKDGQGQSTLLRWMEFEDALRNELVNFRAKKLGRDPREYFRGAYIPDPYIAAVIAEAAGTDSPLLVERKIDLARWEKLGELELFHYFDLQFLIVFYLKLQILNKWDSIRAEKGRAVLDRLLQPPKGA